MLRIIIDTREQTPWAFCPAQVITQISTLRTGDYALEGDLDFAIERKSMDDFLGTISSGWERFERELNRMDDWAARVIIVEGDYAGFNFTIGADGKPIPPYHRHYMLSPQFVEKRVAELTMRGVSIIFAGTADLSAGLATAIFRQRQQQLNKLNENELNKNRNTNDPQLQAGRNGRSQVR